MRKKICIIGNNANGEMVTDGGRIKLRLYYNLLKENNFDASIVDLCGWKKHLLSIIRRIQKAVKHNDTIIIMAGPKGCRIIIPLVCFFNKKYKKRIIFSALGIGTIDKLVSKMTPLESKEFLLGKINGIKDNKIAKYLKKMTYVLVENETLLNVYKRLYFLDNVQVLTNFRNLEIIERDYLKWDEMKIVFLSRITENKGVFDLMCAVKQLIENEKMRIVLNIYGDNQLNDEEKDTFNSYLLDEKIIYHGAVSSNLSTEIIRKNDLFVLPTKYYGEGTPGALIESMIVGTPILVSSYSQAKDLVNDKENGIIFEFNNYEDLVNKIKLCYENYELLKKISQNSQLLAKKFVFSTYRDEFLFIMTGGNNNENSNCDL